MKVVRAGWTSASFLVYAGALLSLLAAAAWLEVISADHGAGAFAGWTVLFYAVAEALAVGLLVRGRRLAAGLFAFVAVGMFAAMVGAFFSWFGWLHTGPAPFSGFHWGLLGLELLTLLAALVAIRVFRFPLLVAIAAGVGWYFVTDLRALIIVASLVYIGLGAAVRRSSYAALGAVGLVLATGQYSLSRAFVFGGDEPVNRPAHWQGPVAYLCLGLFLALLGMLLFRRGDAAEPT